jgi:uncharacterized membrane protein
MTTAPTPHPDAAPIRIPREGYDFVRLATACIAGFVSAAITFAIVTLVRGWEPWTDLLALCLFAFSGAWSIAYLVHTLVVFTRLDADRLRAVLLATNPTDRAGRIAAMMAGTGPTIAVQWSIIAIASVLVFTVWPGLLRETTTVWFSILVVAASWGVTVVAYAVHYARFDVAAGGFEYPGKTRGRVFTDYLYLAAQVQTTFSSSDVSITEPKARSLVTGHTLVSFAFNTVIIAVLITVIFIGGSPGS